jgi:hypothetical protein
MQAQMYSNVSIEITTDVSFKYTLVIPVGAQYEDVFKALEVFKSSVEQMRENALKVEKEQQEKESEKKEE